MHRQRTATAGRIARWLLLACTLLGLALMHTIGHTGPHAGKHHELGAAAAAPGPVAMTVLSPAECPAGHCDGHGSGGMSGWSVCMAILGGLVTVALLVVLLAWVMSGRGRVRDEAVGHRRVPRGPPWPSAGLALTSVAVLRI